jgi:hypothetical protein
LVSFAKYHMSKCYTVSNILSPSEGLWRKQKRISHYSTIFNIRYAIFINRNWVITRWQYAFTHK